MAKFRLQQLGKRIGMPEIRTVEEIREANGEPMYSIQLSLAVIRMIRKWRQQQKL
jgi:predicted DNA-binding protein